MSISCPLEDSTASSSALVLVPVPQRTLSPRRLEANRRNAQRSTGPRTARGKARVSRNALKHGLCAAHAHLPEECDATFNLHVAEIEAELQPRTVLQRILCTQIANLLWQIRKLPEAQAKLFSHERAKAMPDGEHPGTDEEPSIPPCEVLARRFSDAPTCNGFLLLERYERGMHSRLMRLMREYERLKKDHPTTPYHENEIQEFKEDHQRRQQERREQQRREVEQWKQTQAKPAENAPGASGGPIRDVSDDAPMTEQTQRALENEPPLPTMPRV